MKAGEIASDLLKEEIILKEDADELTGILTLLGRYDDAEKLTTPDNPLGFCSDFYAELYRGRSLLAGGNLKRAVDSFKKAFRKGDSEIKMFAAAKWLSEAGYPKRAATYLEKLNKKEFCPEIVIPLYIEMLEKTGKKDAAEKLKSKFE